MKTVRISFPPAVRKEHWKMVVCSGVELHKGTNKIKVIFDKENFNLNYLKFTVDKIRHSISN